MLRSPLLGEVRDAFVFAVYAQGMRWGDLALLEWSSFRFRTDGSVRLGYAMRKNGKFVEMLLPGPAVAILDRYRHRKAVGVCRVFPALDGETTETRNKERRHSGGSWPSTTSTSRC